MFGRRFFLACAAAALIATTAACNGSSDDNPTAPTPPPPQGPAELQITELAIGDGAEVVANALVVLHFTLWHYDPNGPDGKGLQDQTSTNGNPVTFNLADPMLITGFKQGVIGMRVGGRRRFIVPPSLGFGSTGLGNIRPNEWIVFEVDVRAVPI